MRAALVALALAGCKGNEAPEPAAAVVAPVVAPVPAFDKVLALGRADTYMCALRASGAVDCWGPDVRRVAGVSDAVAIAKDASCVIRRGGSLACFTDEGRTLATRPEVTGVVAVGDGCGVLATGAVACEDPVTKQFEPALGASDAIAIAARCVQRRDRSIACVQGSTVQPVLARAGVFAADDASAVACGLDGATLTCASTQDPTHRVTLADHFAGATQLSIGRHDRGDYVIDALVRGRVVWARLSDPALGLPTIAPNPPPPAAGDVTAYLGPCKVHGEREVICSGTNHHGLLARPITDQDFGDPNPSGKDDGRPSPQYYMGVRIPLP